LPLANAPSIIVFHAAIAYEDEKFNLASNVHNIAGVNFRWFIQHFYQRIGQTPVEPINFRLSVGVSLVNARKKK